VIAKKEEALTPGRASSKMRCQRKISCSIRNMALMEKVAFPRNGCQDFCGGVENI